MARPVYSLAQAWAVRAAHYPDSILLVRPSSTAPISVTGTACALNCAHCGARYLEHMQPIWELDVKSAKSCLISGGSDAQGVVRLAPYAAEISRLGQNYRLNLHVGLIDPDELADLKLPIDVISFDLVGDAATAREVYGLDVSLGMYIAQLEALQRIAPVVPHITIGLHAGQIRGEYAAIDALRALSPDRLVFIVLIPTAGTRYAGCAPPDLDEVARVLTYARCTLPDTWIALGCMRPHGRYRQQLDEMAVRAGVNAIVNPTRAAERAIEASGLSITMGDECCALY
ncbi:MAG: radical SAM protein [Anaerolineae bacterium]